MEIPESLVPKHFKGLHRNPCYIRDGPNFPRRARLTSGIIRGSGTLKDKHSHASARFLLLRRRLAPFVVFHPSFEMIAYSVANTRGPNSDTARRETGRVERFSCSCGGWQSLRNNESSRRRERPFQTRFSFFLFFFFFTFPLFLPLWNCKYVQSCSWNRSLY